MSEIRALLTEAFVIAILASMIVLAIWKTIDLIRGRK